MNANSDADQEAVSELDDVLQYESYHIGHQNYSFTEMYDSLFEGEFTDLEKAKKAAKSEKRRKGENQAVVKLANGDFDVQRLPDARDLEKGDKIVWTTESAPLSERSYDDLPDEKIKKLYNQMKDEQLSPVAAQQFKMILIGMNRFDL